MMSVRHHLAASCAQVWGSSFGKWAVIVLTTVTGIGALFDPFYGMLCSMGWLGINGLVWLGMTSHALMNAYREGSFWAGCFGPIVALCGVIALSVPAVWLGGRLHVYGILALNYSNYQSQATIELRKPNPQILVWNYGGWLSDDQDIVWDSYDHPEARLPQAVGGGSATCQRLFGHYYNCGIWY